MKSEDFNSRLSPYTSRAVQYFESTNPTGIASLTVSLVWVACGLAVLGGYSAFSAVAMMVVTYLLARVVGHFDDSSESQMRMGRHGEIREHEADGIYTCTRCSKEKSRGNLRMSYNVYYLLDYEVARTERSKNMKCQSCVSEEEQRIEPETVELETN